MLWRRYDDVDVDLNVGIIASGRVGDELSCVLGLEARWGVKEAETEACSLFIKVGHTYLVGKN